MAAPLKRDYIFTEHALERMKRRGLPEETVRAVLAAPEERLEVRPGRMMFQAKVTMDAPERTFLVRVIVDVSREPAEVVTAYRTSKISKYVGGKP